jgi:hypothetical protein
MPNIRAVQPALIGEFLLGPTSFGPERAHSLAKRSQKVHSQSLGAFSLLGLQPLDQPPIGHNLKMVMRGQKGCRASGGGVGSFASKPDILHGRGRVSPLWRRFHVFPTCQNVTESHGTAGAAYRAWLTRLGSRIGLARWICNSPAATNVLFAGQEVFGVQTDGNEVRYTQTGTYRGTSAL